MKKKACFLVLLTPFVSTVLSFSCKSPSGNDIDWFVAYKYPKLKNSPGTTFLYADPFTPWTLSDSKIDSANSMLGRTVSQLLNAKKDKNNFFVAYNDEHPNGKTDSGRGHMKGVLLFNDISGFWLIHSVPKFPATEGIMYTYPKSGLVMGQSLLCITFSSSELNNIGTQLLYGQPSVYDKNIPLSFAHFYPSLLAVFGGAGSVTKRFKTPPASFSIKPLLSLKGQTFKSFYKTKKFGKDLYEALVAPELQTSLFVETWLNGGGDLPSDCKTNYKVINVRAMKLMDSAFENSKDHSKWAVSLNGSSQSWICIGDINRQKSQERRGGGTTCFSNSKIASLYESSVAKAECCPEETSGSMPVVAEQTLFNTSHKTTSASPMIIPENRKSRKHRLEKNILQKIFKYAKKYYKDLMKKLE